MASANPGSLPLGLAMISAVCPLSPMLTPHINGAGSEGKTSSIRSMFQLPDSSLMIQKSPRSISLGDSSLYTLLLLLLGEGCLPTVLPVDSEGDRLAFQTRQAAFEVLVARLQCIERGEERQRQFVGYFRIEPKPEGYVRACGREEHGEQVNVSVMIYGDGDLIRPEVDGGLAK